MTTNPRRLVTKSTPFGVKFRDVDLSLKAVGDDGSFTGYGSVFGVIDSYQEIVAPGAFTESLRELAAKGRPLPILWQHRSDEPVGAWTKLKEDSRGLYGEGQILLDAGALEQRVHKHMKARTVSGLSIGYFVRESTVDEKTGIRTLTKLDLVEVSLVTFPANDDARVDTVKAGCSSPREIEQAFRQMGVSGRKARAAACAAWRKINESDDDDSVPPAAVARMLESIKRLEAYDRRKS